MMTSCLNSEYFIYTFNPYSKDCKQSEELYKTVHNLFKSTFCVIKVVGAA